MSLHPTIAALVAAPALPTVDTPFGPATGICIERPMTHEQVQFALTLAEIVATIDRVQRLRPSGLIEAAVRQEAMDRLVALVDAGPADQMVAFFAGQGL